MPARRIDLATWPRAGAYHLFKTFEQPHFSLTTRLDVTHLMARKAERGLSPFRTCLWAFSVGFHAVPELRTRFRAGDEVVEHDRLSLSPTIGKPDGSFGFGYIDHDPDRAVFDAAAEAEIAAVRSGAPRAPNSGRDDMIYLSCLPWVDFTALTNAMPGPEDCIPRIAWGKFVEANGRTTCAFGAEIHHAIADGAHLGRAIEAIQDTLDSL